MNKKSFFKVNPVGDLVQELKEQDMTKVAAGAFLTITKTSYCDSAGQANLATVVDEGAFCTLSAECNKTYSC